MAPTPPPAHPQIQRPSIFSPCPTRRWDIRHPLHLSLRERGEGEGEAVTRTEVRSGHGRSHSGHEGPWRARTSCFNTITPCLKKLPIIAEKASPLSCPKEKSARKDIYFFFWCDCVMISNNNHLIIINDNADFLINEDLIAAFLNQVFPRMNARTTCPCLRKRNLTRVWTNTSQPHAQTTKEEANNRTSNGREKALQMQSR